MFIVTHLLIATHNHDDSDRDSVTEACSVFDRNDAIIESVQKSSIMEIEEIFSSQETRFERDMVLLKLLAE